MKYKVGDKVRIKSIDWYNENKDSIGSIDCDNMSFVEKMSKFCGQIATIVAVANYTYFLNIDNKFWSWTDGMIEGLVEEEIDDCEKCGLTRNSTRCLFMDNCLHKNIIEIPEGYELKDQDGNVINATKIVLEKKKEEYPKTYKECCEVLGILTIDLCFDADYSIFDTSKKQWKRLSLMNQFYHLLTCRDAYWNIAGEEMGLDTPWEPDYTNTGEKKFSIWVDFGEIKTGGPFTTTQMVLSFPTEEMRDAFKENFKELIEQCRELL